MSRLVVIVIVSLAAGLAIGAWISGEPEAPTNAPSGAAGHSDQSSTLLSTPDERLLKLEQAIAEEREARLILPALFGGFCDTPDNYQAKSCGKPARDP